MLHVTVDLVPGGVRAWTNTLSNLWLARTNTERNEHGQIPYGDYFVWDRWPHPDDYADDDAQPIGRIEGFDRDRGHRDLASLALRLADIEPGGYYVDAEGVKMWRDR